MSAAPDTGARRPPRLRSDAQLVAGARAGCSQSGAEIARRYRSELRAVCARVAGPDAADDAVQEALIKALAALAAGPSPANLRAWLHRIARNAAIDQLRNRRPWEPLDPQIDGVAQPPQIAADRAQLRDVLAGVAALPERQRTALRMRVVDECSYDEIGVALGAEDGAVRALLHRARSSLREVAAVMAIPFWRGARHGSLAHTGAGAGATLKTGLAIGALAAAGAAGVGLHARVGTPAREPVVIAGQPIAQATTGPVSPAPHAHRAQRRRQRTHRAAAVHPHTATVRWHHAATSAAAAPVRPARGTAAVAPRQRPDRRPAAASSPAAPPITTTQPAATPAPTPPPVATPPAPEAPVAPAPVVPPPAPATDLPGTPAPPARGQVSAWTPDAVGASEGLLAVQSASNPPIARRVTAATDVRCYRVAGEVALSLGACPLEALVPGTPVASAEMQPADAGASWRLVYLIIPA